MNPDQIRLREIHRKATASYQSGEKHRDRLVPTDDAAFLASLGISTQVLLDYVEDFANYGNPDRETFVQVAEICRDYFRSVLSGTPSTTVVPMCELPPKPAEWDGIPWLPRISKKAECLLQGTLCMEAMYGCSGDRAFLKKFHLTLPEFLEIARDAHGKPTSILQHFRNDFSK